MPDPIGCAAARMAGSAGLGQYYGIRGVFPWNDLGARRQSEYVLGRHEVKPVPVKAHHLRLHAVAVGHQHRASAAHRKLESDRFHDQPRDAGKMA